MRIFYVLFRSQVVRVSLIFIFLAIVFTLPLISHINTYLPGFASTDEPYAVLWHFGLFKQMPLWQIGISHVNMVAAPFGVDVSTGYLYWNIINKLLVRLTDSAIAFNIQVLSSFFFSLLFAYLLAFYVMKNIWQAFLTAVIFAFCPYHFARSWQHLGLAHIQWMPLYIFSILALWKKKSLRMAVFSGFAFALVMAFDFYYAYFMAVAALIFVIYDFFCQKKLKESFRLIGLFFVSILVVMATCAFDIFAVFKYMSGLSKVRDIHGAYGYIRPFEDLFSQSARPLSYLLPSTEHPLFGGFTRSFVGGSLYGASFTEHALYLGWVGMILAFVASRRWLKLRKDKGPEAEKQSYYIGFFIFLAAAAWLFSQPPWWNFFGLKIYMPSFFMYKIAPMFRAYCRFGIVLMLAVAVLAGFGLKFILERFKTAKTKAAMAVLFIFLACFEFWNYPPFKVIDLSRVPAVYYWLKTQPGDFTIAEYPLDLNGANTMYMFYQATHEKKMINATTPGTYANKVAQVIKQLSHERTARILKWMGVKYVLAHKDDYLNTGLVQDGEELQAVIKNSGLKFVRSFSEEDCPKDNIMCVRKTGPIDVYEVVASNSEKPVVAE